jgi:2-amino-4-hydroxy-6-hydroxymethyldihydropteridine diphosphokinase
MIPAYVGLGSNLDDPRRHLQDAVQELTRLPHTQLVLVSDLYRSAPIGTVHQPDFLNSVVQLDTELAADALLDALQEIEDRHGRERPFPGAPRTLDLDLLLYGEQSIATPRLTVPHPRMHERAFVLAPLAEIAPESSIPGRGRVTDLLTACSGQRIERIE